MTKNSLESIGIQEHSCSCTYEGRISAESRKTDPDCRVHGSNTYVLLNPEDKKCLDCPNSGGYIPVNPEGHLCSYYGCRRPATRGSLRRKGCRPHYSCDECRKEE